MAYDVFISYSRKDKDIAVTVRDNLQKKGVSCWIDSRDISLACDDWGDELAKALDESKLMVLIFSSNTNESVHVKDEVLMAATRKMPIITFRIEDEMPLGSLEKQLLRRQWFDALDPPCKKQFEEALKSNKCCKQIETFAEEVNSIINSKTANSKDFDKICSFCGTTNPVDSAYCKNCGEAFKLRTDIHDGDLSKSCTSCDTLNLHDAKFCTYCGISLNGRKPSPGFRLNKIHVVGIVSVILILAVAGIVFGLISWNPVSQKSITIASPSEGASVSTFTLITGYTKNLGSDDNVYVLVQPQPSAGEGQFEWWISQPKMSSDGTWQCNVQLGESNGDIGRTFTVCAIVTKERLQVGKYGVSLPNSENSTQITVIKRG